MPRLPKSPSSRMLSPKSRMLSGIAGPKMDMPTDSGDGSPPLPRYNARALRPGGMAMGGSVSSNGRGDGSATRGRTRGRVT